MVHDRNNILKDLRGYVIEFTYTDKSMFRLTLRTDLLPPSYLNEINEEKKFHEENANIIAAWNISKPGGWKIFNIENIAYMQIIDGY